MANDGGGGLGGDGGGSGKKPRYPPHPSGGRRKTAPHPTGHITTSVLLQRMKVGINYPWSASPPKTPSAYGWDFGIGPWGAQPPWRTALSQDLDELIELGVFAVRWFILGDGITYGGFDAHGNLVQPRDRSDPGVAAILRDFEDAVKIFDEKRSKIRLLPVLVNYEFTMDRMIAMKDGDEVIKVMGGDLLYGKCGRRELLENGGALTTFLAVLIEPLIAVAKRYSKCIYAIDVMNEPDLLGGHEASDISAIEPYLKRSIELVNRAGLVSTIGFQRRPMLEHYQGRLGETLLQFHCYVEQWNKVSGPPGAPPKGQSSRTRCILGELSTEDHGLEDKLKMLDELGYEAAFPWSMHDTEETRWDAATRSTIRKFTLGR